MADIRTRIWGIDKGNFEVDPYKPQRFSGDFEEIIAEHNLEYLSVPLCCQGTEIVDFVKSSNSIQVGKDFFVSANRADGGIVMGTKSAIGITTSDSPIIVVYDEQGGRLAVLNGHFRCLVPEPVRGGKKQKGILDVLFENFSFLPNKVKIWIGFGAGPCCLSAEEYDLELENFSLDIPTGRVTRGWNIGRRSLDLYMQIWNRLTKEFGVPKMKIFGDWTCTSCFGLTLFPKYYSDSRGGLTGGRTVKGKNIAFAWIE